MVIAITGSSGLIGSALVRALAERRVRVKRVVRRRAQTSDEIAWQPERGEIDAAGFADVDAVVNLAGENLSQNWTDSSKQRIRDSRVMGTTLLAHTLASLPVMPRTLISGSAVGIYGDRGDEILDETSAVGDDDDFLASVCKEWEAATQSAADAGIRVVTIRTGLVLARTGGVLAKLLLPFRLGAGGKLGSGRQWMSWIARTDVIEAICFLLGAEGIAGPFNLVAPNPVTNAEFSRVLASVLNRPALFTVPRFALKLMLGEMADAAVLASQRVRSRRLIETHFKFTYPTLERALRGELTVGIGD
jgi:uncharacterized protein (TIGR01777 family)